MKPWAIGYGVLARNIGAPRSLRKCSLCSKQARRGLASHGPARLSRFWIPTGGIAVDASETGIHSLLVRAGFIRQSHSGLYQFLPLGFRVQEKVQRLIEKHMQSLGASKLELSTLSSEDLWRKSGRLQGDRSELFSLVDRKGAKYLLSPTHEEEITALVSSLVHTYRDLPLRLYQITRKYRDEPRPRGGLLRSREFLMKDLYTFDVDEEAALKTYASVRKAYDAFFSDLRLPVFSADASSGSIGGNLSHEYHLPSPLGEDEVLRCTSCGWAGNVEIIPVGDPPPAHHSFNSSPAPATPCPSCPSSSALEPQVCIELGHTFHLGTKYSDPLSALVSTSTDPSRSTPLQMGCHGIGVSRLIAGAASHLSDEKGLNWPRKIAPFEVVVIPGKEVQVGEAEGVTDILAKGDAEEQWDVVLDDRDKSFSWKLKDADLIGYPVVVLLGRAWMKDRMVEVQCRRKNFQKLIGPKKATELISGLLNDM